MFAFTQQIQTFFNLFDNFENLINWKSFLPNLKSESWVSVSAITWHNILGKYSSTLVNHSGIRGKYSGIWGKYSGIKSKYGVILDSYSGILGQTQWYFGQI